MKNGKGVITVFLALIYGMLIAFFCTLIDVTRINSTKNQLIVATDAGITSGLSSYQKDLFKDYGMMTFKNGSDITQTVKKIMQENVQYGETTNNLFKIDLPPDNINVTAGDSPFVDDKIMLRQMIYSMKYQGTENLALSVYNQLKQILNYKDVAKDTDDIQALEKSKEKKDLDESIAEMRKAQENAITAVVELAKNNKYSVLNKNNNSKSMGYIPLMPQTALLAIYKNNGPIFGCINNVKSYNNTVYMEKVYSYLYTKMILEMYEKYITKEAEKHSDKDDDKHENKKKLKRANNLNTLLSLLNQRFGNLGYLEPMSSFKQELTDLKKEIEKDKKGVDDIVSHKTVYIQLMQKYNALAVRDQCQVRDMADSTYKEYMKILDDSTTIQSELQNVITKITSIISTLDKYDSEMNKASRKANEWAEKHTTDDVFRTMDSVIDLDSPANVLIDTLIMKVCNSDELRKNSKIGEYVLTPMKQMDTVDGISVVETSKLKCQSNEEYETFFQKIKDLYQKINSKPSLSEILDKYDSHATIDKSGLPNTSSEEGESGSFSSQLFKMPSINGVDQVGSFIDAGGQLADKIYSIEYIMTYFREMVQPKGKRIPELTKCTKNKLKYEIEAIISGKYDDQKSKTTMEDDLFIIRGALNFISLMTYQESLRKFIDVVSLAIAALTHLPKTIIKYMIMTVWVLLETRCDLIDLYNGYKVPLIKTDFEQWCTKFGLNEDDCKNSHQGSTLQSNISSMQKHIEKTEEKSVYNDQDYEAKQALGRIKLYYTDYIRFKLLITDSSKLIDRCQDLITANEDLKGKFQDYDTSLKVDVNNSKVNILFNTQTFSGKGKINKFNEFTFKKAYN
ncbi:DUF5702 domain-containing protein [Inconstantimicrobium mannanitabidum]|uniref:Uncharacterized protein n=1 Tax=Inconstantimicrobium mannanitabidum TaxID=1604901 RepID=A0ACB5RF55_9CLOT|nr:DUF5702 domain-containing protein [Clostridium sp. TW13]GKX67426.1 hypothetical protein rsdtw13_26840 [Clostridium sp. TW13]